MKNNGEIILETLEFKKMTQARLAAEADMDIGLLNKIVLGKSPVTKKTADKIEKVLGIQLSVATK